MSIERVNKLLERMKISRHLATSDRPGEQGAATVAILEQLVGRVEALEKRTADTARRIANGRHTLVIAGDRQEFDVYVRATASPQGLLHYVDSIDQVKDMRGAQVVCVGTYWRNPLHDRVAEVMALTQE